MTFGGRRCCAILSHGGFLAIGGSEIAIPVERLAVSGGQVLLLGLTEDELEMMPEYNCRTDQEPAGSDTVEIGRYQ